MIVYTLRCAVAHEFEAWFRDSAAFGEQTVAGILECPLCGDHAVERIPGGAPNVRTGESRDRARAEQDAGLRAVLASMREIVEKNCKNVGSRFVAEACRIHRGEAKKRSIYGRITADEARALRSKGVACAPLPWLGHEQKN